VLRLLSDENFRGDILRGLKRRLPDMDVVRVQDVGLAGLDDPTILAWAATSGRILLTHDRNTIPEFVYDRVREGLPMPGVFLVDDEQPAGRVIADIVLALECGEPTDWQDFVTYFPL
jgi:hypothetical protein